MASEREEYDGGYADGLSDALSVIQRAGDLETARVEVMKLSGYVTCPACEGSGERKEVTQRDLMKALMSDLGAVVDLSRPCERCWGEKVTLPEKKEPPELIEGVRDALAALHPTT